MKSTARGGMATDDYADMTELLSHVRSVISAAGFTDKIDAEGWLRAWLDTPNGALGGIEPRRLIKHADDDLNI